MGLFGPTTGGGGSQNAPITINTADAKQLVASAPSGSVFLVAFVGDVEVATEGQPWTGTRIFINATTSPTNIRRNNTFSAFRTLKVGELVTLSFDGTSFLGNVTAINHADVRWTGTSSIPEATTSANGLLGIFDKMKLNNLTTAQSYPISTWDRTNGTLTINTSSSHGFSVGMSALLSGTGGADGNVAVASTPTSTRFTALVSGINATGTGGSATRAGTITAQDKNKLDGIASGAQVNVKPDWNAAAGQPEEILNKPTIPAAQVNADWNATSGVAQILNRPGNGASFNISTWSGDGTTTTINAPGHTFLVGQPVTFRNTGSTLLDGLSDVLVLSASTNSFTIASTLNESGFGGFVARRGVITPVQMNQLQTALQNARSINISSWSANGSIATIAANNHGFFTNDSIFITGTGAIDGTYTIAATSADQFTFATTASGTGTTGLATRSGRMIANDKTKLDGIAAGAQVNIKPDWNAAAGTAAEIVNRPLIPILLGHSAFSYAAGGNTRFFSNIFDLGAVTTAVERNFKVPANCTIRAAIFTPYNGGTGTPTGHSGGILRLRNKTSNSTQTILTYNLDGIASGTLGTYSATGLSLAMNATDDYVIEFESGTFTTAPTSVRQMLTLYY